MQREWVVSPDYRAAIDAIKAARIAQKISQRELARRLGKPPSFVNKIELLERRLDILEFVQISQAIGIGPEKLMQTVLAAVTDKACG
ncbi:helix-turn-helix domain-containing protein [Sphingobium phenoxybenzoativorans]|uniref:helix-turn-helix domain-containing protein n=1 Tax=Sphingobium phenoxybenzoativorans TaxID=1592790 RepID=UPI000872A6FA|nr:helix-turn-helix transcriptional regulator [Sphingobium phenoxybenzoativorans]